MNETSQPDVDVAVAAAPRRRRATPEQLLARTQAGIATLEARLNLRRKGVPLPAATDGKAAPDLPFLFTGFDRLDDAGVLDRVSAALRAERYNVIFNNLARILDKARTSICLVSRRVVQRQGRRQPVMFFHTIYSPGFVDMIRSIPESRYDQKFRKWDCPVAAVAGSELRSGMAGVFDVVIDLDTMVVGTSGIHAPHAFRPSNIIPPLPVPAIVHVDRIAAAVAAALGEAAPDGHLALHDGREGLRRFGPDDRVRVFLPRLAGIRRTRDATPWFFEYQVEDGTIVNSGPGLTHPDFLKAVACLADSCDAAGVPVLEAAFAGCEDASP